MSYILDGVSIRAPQEMNVTNSTQVAQQRALSGRVGRDYFGDNKRVWVLEYSNTNKTAYDVIDAIYLSYLNTGTAKTWQVTETNYTISQTTVHIDLHERDFNVKGTNYISDFTLVLTEA